MSKKTIVSRERREEIALDILLLGFKRVDVPDMLIMSQCNVILTDLQGEDILDSSKFMVEIYKGRGKSNILDKRLKELALEFVKGIYLLFEAKYFPLVYDQESGFTPEEVEEFMSFLSNYREKELKMEDRKKEIDRIKKESFSHLEDR